MNFKKLILYILVINIFLSISGYAQNIIPDKVRIGLYYLNTAVESVKLESETGLDIGYSFNNNFISLIREQNLKNITVKKNNFFHIQVGESFVDYAGAKVLAESLKQRGYEAFPTYDGMWRTWVGNYTSNSLASIEMHKLNSNIPEYTYSIINPTKDAIQVIGINNEIELVFSNNLQIFNVAPIIVDGLPNVISVEGRKYRGSIKVTRRDKSDMTIINEVSLEQYLYSVVPSEMPPSWHTEALKAQAVAARTYAVNSLLNSGRVKEMYNPLGFDMTPTVEFQVYHGYSHETARTNEIVNQTKNLLIYYNNSPINAVFFSSSGGFTENSENIWVAQLPYLRGVEDKYQPSNRTNSNWEITVTPDEINQFYKTKNIDIGDITNIRVTSYTPNKNALEMKVIGTKGVQTYNKLKIRNFIRGKSLPSSTFTISKQGGVVSNVITGNLNTQTRSLEGASIITKDGIKTLNNTAIYIKTKTILRRLVSSPLTFVFKGSGAGHGVGMSQWGAKGMAEAGFKFDEILKHYYTGVEVR